MKSQKTMFATHTAYVDEYGTVVITKALPHPLSVASLKAFLILPAKVGGLN